MAALPKVSVDLVDAVAFLAALGAARVRHSNRTLLDHLRGVAQILERWGARPVLVRAGLFHSVYGTEEFGRPLLGVHDRGRLVEEIGEESERLAHLFCTLERRTLFEAVTRERSGEVSVVSPAERRDLLWLVFANALDHVPVMQMTGAQKVDLLRALSQSARLLPDVARRELAAAFSLKSRAQPVGLAALLGLEKPEAFLADRFPHERFVVHGPVERLAGLVDYELDELVRLPRAMAQAFRTVEGKAVRLDIGRGQERALYTSGFTIYLHSVRSPRIDAWVAAIDEELGLLPGSTRVSAFASRRGEGVRPHYDMNENFVCQAQGTKRWRISRDRSVAEPTVGYICGTKPSAANLAEAGRELPNELPEPFDVVDLRPGTVMFVPRGVWHDTATVEEASLHFNIQCGLPTWRDAIEFLLRTSTSLHVRELRGGVPNMFDGGGLRQGLDEELKSRLGRLVDAVRSGDIAIDERAFRRFVARRRTA